MAVVLIGRFGKHHLQRQILLQTADLRCPRLVDGLKFSEPLRPLRPLPTPQLYCSAACSLARELRGLRHRREDEELRVQPVFLCGAVFGHVDARKGLLSNGCLTGFPPQFDRVTSQVDGGTLLSIRHLPPFLMSIRSLQLRACLRCDHHACRRLRRY